jgi:hypothetical protein
MRNLFVGVSVALCLFVFSRSVDATVTALTFSETPVAGDGAETHFTFTFPYISQTHVKVKKVLIASPYTETILTYGTHYTVSSPGPAVGGTIATASSGTGFPIPDTYNVVVYREVPYTQTTAFRSQGSYSARDHEFAFDKLTMAVQQVASSATTSAETTAAIAAHIASSTDHNAVYVSQAGVAGGQTLYGGTAVGDDLAIVATSGDTTTGTVSIGSYATFIDDDAVLQNLTVDDTLSVTLHAYIAGILHGNADTTHLLTLYGGESTDHDGHVAIGVPLAAAATLPAIYVDESNRYVGYGTLFPEFALDIVDGSVTSSKTTRAAAQNDSLRVHGTIFGGGSTESAHALTLSSTLHATKGKIMFGASGAYDEANGRIGIGTTSPTVPLDVVGAGAFTGAVSLLHGLTVTTTDPQAVTATADCGDVYQTVTDNLTFTLPDAAAANKGCSVTFVNTASAGGALIEIDPDASDEIVGSCNAVAIDGGNGKMLRNTKATQIKGDSVTLVSDGVALWFIQSCHGIWAHE